MPERAATADLTWRSHWPAALLAAAAALLALWGRHHLFPYYSWNRDEPVYLWHVEALRAGYLTPTDGGHPLLFHPWLSAHGDGTFFTQYTLGWPLVLLAAALLTGSAGAALLVGAALAVIGTYAISFELLRDRRIATVAATLMVASPILPIQGGVYLSYLFTLGLGLIFGSLLLSGIRLAATGRLLTAGLVLGWIFLTRPYDAVLWGAAFGIYALMVHRGRWRDLLRPAIAGALTCVPLVVLTLAYNERVTGGWLEFPISAADHMDTFGFGPKRLMPTFEIIDYDAGKALVGTAKNAFLLPWFLVGSYAGLATAALGLWQGRREGSTRALVLIGAVFPIGYLVFWGTYLSSLASRISGPIYLVPLYAPICLLIASVLVRWWTDRRRRAWALIAVLVVGTAPAALSRFDVNRDISVRQRPWRTSVEHLAGPALVFVVDTGPYLLYFNPFSANSPRLDDNILYATDGTPEMLDLIAENPERVPYLQRASMPSPEVGPRENPEDLAVRLTRAHVRRGASLSLRIKVAPPKGTPFARVEVWAGPGTIAQSLDVGDAGHVAALEVALAAPGASSGLVLDQRGTLSVTVSFGTTAAEAADEPRVRALFVYRIVDGEIEILTPAALNRNKPPWSSPQWFHTLDLDELHVEVAAA